jgi:membrane fusion protein, heavy metal efflux system
LKLATIGCDRSRDLRHDSRMKRRYVVSNPHEMQPGRTGPSDAKGGFLSDLQARLRHSPALLIGAIIAIGVVVSAIIMLTSRGGGSADGEPEPPGLLEYARGPHGARLLSDGPLQLEITIYETGVEPHFRIYPYDADGKPIAPAEVNLVIELHRLGGRVDRITFRPEADYLLGEGVVQEPHSFDVKVAADYKGARHTWEYSQIEGKVKLGADQLKSAGIEILTAGPRQMTTTLELPGEIKADETRLAHVSPRLQGVVTEVMKKEGDYVRRGEVIAVLNSRELANAKSAFLAATHHAEFTSAALKREEMLWNRKISAERDYLEAKKDFDEAELALKLAAQTLVVLGVPSSSLAGLASAPPESMARFEVRAPLDGTVIERNVTVGEAITADESIFAIADLSSVWIEVTVYAKDAGAVHQGQVARVRSGDLGSELTGRVSYIGPLVGEETRAATARIVVPNAGGRWRPGLYVTVELVREATMVPVVVAASAIQTFRDWQVVFVRYGDWFEGRPLELGRSDGEWVEVISGLAPGEQYAATNSFAVKAEIGKLGATHDH